MHFPQISLDLTDLESHWFVTTFPLGFLSAASDRPSLPLGSVVEFPVLFYSLSSSSQLPLSHNVRLEPVLCHYYSQTEEGKARALLYSEVLVPE